MEKEAIHMARDGNLLNIPYNADDILHIQGQSTETLGAAVQGHMNTLSSHAFELKKVHIDPL